MPHVIPAGALVTVPVPLPDRLTVSVRVVVEVLLKVAVTPMSVLTVTLQVPLGHRFIYHLGCEFGRSTSLL